MNFKSEVPVIVTQVGHYADRQNPTEPMRRRNGTVVEWVEIISSDAPLGTPTTQIPCAEGTEIHKLQPGCRADITLHVRTELKAQMGRNGSPYTQPQTKLRLVGYKVTSNAPAQAA